MRTVALISYDFSTRIAGGAVRAIEFARRLPEHGWRPIVLTASPPDEHPALPGEVSIRFIPSRERSFGGGIRAESLGGNPPWLRALSALKRLVPLERQLTWYRPFQAAALSLPGVDAVLTITAPYSMMALGHRLARRNRAPHIVDLRDDWQDRYRIEPRSAANRFLMDRFAHRYLGKAAGITVVSPVTQDRLRTVGLKATLVANGYVETHFEEVPFEAEVVEAGEGLTLLHLGWLGSFRSLIPLLDARERLIESGTQGANDIMVDQVGLVEPEERERIGRHPGARCVTFSSQVDHREAITRMRSAQVLLAIPGHQIPAAVSGKLYEYLRARRPILLLAGQGAARQVATEVGVQTVADPADSDAIAGTLKALLEARRRGDLRATSDPARVETFERGHGVARLATLLGDVT